MQLPILELINHKKLYECIYFFLCMVLIVTVDGYNSESFQSRASQGRPKTDVLSSKTKVLIFKRCPKISEKCEGLFWCLDHTGSRPARQTDGLKPWSAFTVSLSPLSKANTHPSKLQTHFFQRRTHIALNCKQKYSPYLTFVIFLTQLQFKAKKHYNYT